MPATQLAVMPVPNSSCRMTAAAGRASSLTAAKTELRESCRPPRSRPMAAWSKTSVTPVSDTPAANRASRPSVPLMSAKRALICGAARANAMPSSSDPAPQVTSAAEIRPARACPPGQLADQHRAQAEHPDRAEQRHGRHGGRAVPDGLLAEQPGGQRPVGEAEHRRHAGGGDQAARVPQQVLMPLPARQQARPAAGGAAAAAGQARAAVRQRRRPRARRSCRRGRGRTA